VLEAARLLQDYVEREGMEGTDRRSVLFMGFGAEEEGLLGSCHYVFEAPRLPLAVTRAMMNFDMVGRLRDFLVVSGQETAAAWPSMVSNANAPGLPVVRPEQSSASGTDHACFWRAEIPWVGFFTGFHDQYHQPADDVGLINFQGMVGIGELALRILTRLMVMPEPPTLLVPYPNPVAPPG
jgi:Zn-dependent M28 family amino/carboxypeptidase